MASARVNPLTRLKRGIDALQAVVKDTSSVGIGTVFAVDSAAAKLRSDMIAMFTTRGALQRNVFVEAARRLFTDTPGPDRHVPTVRFVNEFMDLWQAEVRYKHLFRLLRIELMAFMNLMGLTNAVQHFAWAATHVFWQMVDEYRNGYAAMQVAFDTYMRVLDRITTLALVREGARAHRDRAQEAELKTKLDAELDKVLKTFSREKESVWDILDALKRLSYFVHGEAAMAKATKGWKWEEYVFDVTGKELAKLPTKYTEHPSAARVVYSLNLFLTESDRQGGSSP